VLRMTPANVGALHSLGDLHFLAPPRIWSYAPSRWASNGDNRADPCSTEVRSREQMITFRERKSAHQDRATPFPSGAALVAGRSNPWETEVRWKSTVDTLSQQSFVPPSPREPLRERISVRRHR
jgi:hypothetical protein